MATNAIKLLKNDHDKVRKLLKELVGASAEQKRKELLEEVGKEIIIHSRIEEEIFYPAFREAGGKDHEKMFFEAREEHRAVEELVLPDLKRASPGEEAFSGRAKVLKDLVEHHAEEEEDEMFEKAEKTMSDKELESLGERLSERKEELKQEL